MKTVIVLDTLDMPVRVEQHANKRYRVTYGQQVRDNLTYEEAAQKFGYCAFHSASCAGLLDLEE